ncbi:cytosolic phospholipase A2-like [Clavelina lepadiformis]|uniref:cytosolic phospholipase A2-like n=1 Tax=Clavelina lepadiformis TaxID=159417 RepID=UPI004042E297
MYQAEVTPCLSLTVRVLRGRNISHGRFWNLFDTPDPYVKVYVAGAPEARRQTKYIRNNKCPEWNEMFSFLLPTYGATADVEITLMDSNYLKDENMGSAKFDLLSLNADEAVTKTFEFNGTSQVEIEFNIENKCESDLRLGATLCDKEESFRKARKEKIFKSIRQLLEKHRKEGRPLTAEEAPVIGVLGSGGGFRAMVGYAGVMKALHDTGILDCSMYVNGLSGSSWYLATLYANETFPANGLDEAHNEIRSNIDSHPLLIFLSRYLSYRRTVIAKKKAGQPVSYTDIFGMVIGNTLLGKEKMESSKLSKFQEMIADGSAPMPILTAVHVRSNKSAAIFHDWVEFSPYEIGIAKYASFIDTKHFGTKFFCGVQAKQFPENPFHYVMGICGSAYAILFQDYVRSFAEGNRFLSFLLKPIWQDSKKPDETKVKEASEKLNLSQNGFSSEVDYNRAVLRSVAIARRRDDDDDTDEEANQEKIKRATAKKKTKTKPKPKYPNTNHQKILQMSQLFRKTTNMGQTFKKINEPLEVDKKKMYVADAGIAFNSPYPPMLRAERGVDIILSFDFSGRKEADMDPLKELYLAEKWTKASGKPFPKISEDTYKKEELKECYVFRDEENEKAPIVIHFVLCNIDFRNYSAPGIPREQEDDWGDFDIFSKQGKPIKCNPYSTFNFHYTKEQFDKLFQLMKFNTLQQLDTILKEIIYTSDRRRRHHS